MNKVHQNLRFRISESFVDVSNMGGRVFHEFGVVVITHRNNMFSQWSFYGHLNVVLCLWSIFDDIVDLIYLFCTDRRKHFFDFDNFRHADVLS